MKWQSTSIWFILSWNIGLLAIYLTAYYHNASPSTEKRQLTFRIAMTGPDQLTSCMSHSLVLSLSTRASNHSLLMCQVVKLLPTNVQHPLIDLRSIGSQPSQYLNNQLHRDEKIDKTNLYRPRFKYRLSRPRYRPISHFLPATDTIWENRSLISFAAKKSQYLKYQLTNCSISGNKSPKISPDMK